MSDLDTTPGPSPVVITKPEDALPMPEEAGVPTPVGEVPAAYDGVIEAPANANIPDEPSTGG